MSPALRYEQHDLDGRGARRVRVYDVAPVTEPVYSGITGEVIGQHPTYWPAVTDVPCPVCVSGVLRWAEAGYVPGYRICEGCHRHFIADGTAEQPTVIRFHTRRGMPL